MGNKVVSRFWKQLECKSRSRARHQRKSCVGCKTGWILGTGISSSRNDYHAKVWNLWCHLPSKDTSELVTDVHLGPWKVECRYFPGTRQFPWLLCNLREGWGLNILLVATWETTPIWFKISNFFHIQTLYLSAYSRQLHELRAKGRPYRKADLHSVKQRLSQSPLSPIVEPSCVCFLTTKITTIIGFTLKNCLEY